MNRSAKSAEWQLQNVWSWRQVALLLSMVLLSCVGAQRAVAGTVDEAIVEIAASLGAQATEKGAKDLAVVGFSEINGYQSAMTDFLAEELTTALFSAGDFSVVERSQLARVMEEHQLYTTNLFDPDRIAELQKLLGVDAIVAGTVTRLGKQIRVNARVIDVTTARVFGAAATTIDNDPLVNSLLGQSSVASRSKVAVAGQVQQPSDVVFQSRYFIVTPISVIRSDDGRSVKVTVEVRNTLNETILIGSNYSGGQRTAMTHAGTVLSIHRPSGIKTISRGQSPSTEVLPGSTLIVQWYTEVRDKKERLLGDSISIRDQWGIQTDNGLEWIQIQFPKIMIN